MFNIQSVLQNKRKLFVNWDDGHKSTFHYIWLRDNCYCSICGNPQHGEKRFQITDIPLEIEPFSVNWHSGKELVVNGVNKV